MEKTFFQKFWFWLNGNKTTFGLFFLWVITQTWFTDILPDGTIEDAVISVLNWLGGILAGTGFIHKSAKLFGFAYNPKKINDETETLI